MADDRTSTIIKEIQYWKEHKLLPETHCNFLLALYTQGEDEKLPANTKRRNRVNPFIQMFLLVLLVPFSFLVVYFTQFNLILQLSILVLFITYAFWVFCYFRNKDLAYVHIPFIVLLVLVLILTDFITNLFLLNQYITLLLFIANFIGWYILGRRLQYRYLMFASVLAIIILLFSNFSHLFSFN